MSEPRTAAGRALLDGMIGLGADPGNALSAILAIEDQAAAARDRQVSELREALDAHEWMPEGEGELFGWCSCDEWPFVEKDDAGRIEDWRNHREQAVRARISHAESHGTVANTPEDG